MSAREQNGDGEPDTDPIRRVAREIHDEAVVQKVDALLADVRRLEGKHDASDARIGRLEGHARSHEALLHGLSSTLEGQHAGTREEIRRLSARVDGYRRDSEQRRIEAGRASSPNLDAQALQQTIEGGFSVLGGTVHAMRADVDGIRKALGAEPNTNLEIKGSGVLGRLHALEQQRTRIVDVVGVVGGLGGLVALVAWAWRLFGGH